jgi:glycosyltransferase involved in cell wall biosynthesis
MLQPRQPPAARSARQRAAQGLRRALIGWARGGAPHPSGGPPKVYILLMHAWGMGGTIRTVLNLASHLSVAHDVEILSMVRRQDEPFFDFPENVAVTAIDDQRPGTRGGMFHRVLRSCPSVLAPRVDRSSRALTLWSDVMLARALRRREPGVLMGTRAGLNMIVADAAPPGFVKVGQEHMNLASHKPALRRAIQRRYHGLDALVVLTEGDRDGYQDALGDSVRVTCIPNAVPHGGGPRSPLTATTVLAAGRLTPQKGFDRLIPAFAQAVERHPDWQLRICGRGPLRSRLKALVAEYGVEANVTLPGPSSDIWTEMDNASIFVVSSRFEGFPMVLLEAMAKGLPIVSFDCPTGPREVIETGANGALVPADDIRALGRALVEMIEDTELRRRCADGALATAQEYTLERIGPRWDALLAELAAVRPSR